VDDEEGILRSGQGILERLGYSVDATTTPAEALELFSRDPDAYDLVITDMTMPKMTGLELAETIHVIRPGVAVVLCTGFGFGIMDERIRKAGIKDVVMKPMIPGELAGVVHHVLNNR